jgi:hypothetical protein
MAECRSPNSKEKPAATPRETLRGRAGKSYVNRAIWGRKRFSSQPPRNADATLKGHNQLGFKPLL